MAPLESTRKTMIPGAKPPTVYSGMRKRPYSMTSWQESFQKLVNPKRQKSNGDSFSSKIDEKHKHHFGLVDLFGDNRWVRPKDKEPLPVVGKRQRNPTDPKTGHDGFFTLRTEHRRGGPLAKHAGEERVLLFRSDKPGVIAKIVFSSSPVVTSVTRSKPSPASPSSKISSLPKDAEIHEGQSPIAANAMVHVLFVKDDYRGFDLGGLLFALCTTYLRERYSATIESGCGTRRSSKNMSRIHCRLDVEEDVRRHEKLVHFYEHMGCRKRSRAKITFINNNDGETYRRVPMAMDLLMSPSQNKSHMDRNQTHIAAAYPSFLPVLLVSASGETARVNNQLRHTWLIVECQDGNIELGTTDGKMLRTDGDGRCKLVPGTACTTSAGMFRLLRVSDELDEIVYNREEDDDSLNDKLHAQQQDPPIPRCAMQPVHRKELWMVRSTLDGTFLGMASDHTLVLSQTTCFWQADTNFCLTHTFDSPARRQHQRRMWRTQCVAYVTAMRKRYASFDLHKTTLETALIATRHKPANPFSVTGLGEPESKAAPLPSLRTLLFHTAELARAEGHPDWVQFVALVHGLAGAMTCLGSVDPSAARMVVSKDGDDDDDDDDEDDFDWTIYVDARVMGCKTFEDSTFAEFRHLNPDRDDACCNTTNGLYGEHVGLENVLLSWTSSDYLYDMLKHNRVRLPGEAYAILKLFPLVDWHTRGKYTSLSNEVDEELKPFVADFYQLFHRSREIICSRGCADHHEMTDQECHNLWTNHYSLIAQKYGAGEILNW